MRFPTCRPLFARWLKTGTLLLMTALLLSGCGTDLMEYYFEDVSFDFFKSSDSDIQRPAEQLAREGVLAMENEDYEKALEMFQQLKEQYPYSKYSILAELKVGDAHFLLEQYSDAALAYEEFAKLHPRNEVVPYVLYQKGMCHFLSFKTIDRDQGETRLALESFERLVKVFPDTDYGKKAKKQIFECRKRLAAHGSLVGKVYHRIGRYRSASIRLQSVLEEYPDALEALGLRQEVEETLEESKRLEPTQDDKSIWSKIGF